MVEWICENYKWAFSGVGITILLGIGWLLKHIHKKICLWKEDQESKKKDHTCPPCMEDLNIKTKQ